jgi:hypothetical protein
MPPKVEVAAREDQGMFDFVEPRLSHGIWIERQRFEAQTERHCLIV